QWIRPPFDLSSIRDHRRTSAVAGQIVFLNYPGVGNCLRRQNRSHSFGHPIILSADPIPLLSLVLETVDIQRDRGAYHAQDRSKRRVRRVANQRRIVTTWHGV